MSIIVSNIICNEILNALVNSKGLNIQVFLDQKFGISKKETVAFYERKLKDEGHVTYHTLPDRSLCHYISPSGAIFQKHGGYPTDTLTLAKNLIEKSGIQASTPKSFDETFSDLSNKTISSINQLSKSTTEINDFITEITKIKEYLETRITVIGKNELEPFYTKILVFLRDYYGNESAEVSQFKRIKKSVTTNRLIPFLVKIITEQELKIKRVTNGKTKPSINELGASDLEVMSRLGHTVKKLINPNDKKLINYVLNECENIKQALELTEYSDFVKIRGHHTGVGALLNRIYIKEQNPFNQLTGSINRDELISICTIVKHDLEIELLDSKSILSNLHPKVLEVSEKQFNNNHYRDAVVNSYIALIEVIKEKFPNKNESGKLKDGVELMQEVFSKGNPKIKFSEDGGEQQGMMNLYIGAVGGIRNKYGHKTSNIKDEKYALELLHFASALFRLFDDPSIY